MWLAYLNWLLQRHTVVSLTLPYFEEKCYSFLRRVSFFLFTMEIAATCKVATFTCAADSDVDGIAVLLHLQFGSATLCTCRLKGIWAEDYYHVEIHRCFSSMLISSKRMLFCATSYAYKLSFLLQNIFCLNYFHICSLFASVIQPFTRFCII